MRVIRKSNFDHDDHRGDQYFVTCVLSPARAEAVARALNEIEGEHSDDLFSVVADDYVLPPDWQP